MPNYKKMNWKLWTIAGLVLFGASCSKASKTVPAPEAVFDSTGQQVITSSFNKKQLTMSVLYGNALAMKTASGIEKKHVPGELFTLVTWKQQPSPYWFGSNINGEMQVIEQVHFNAGAFDYVRVIKKDVPQEPAAAKEERIRFIVNQDASVFP